MCRSSLSGLRRPLYGGLSTVRLRILSAEPFGGAGPPRSRRLQDSANPHEISRNDRGFRGEWASFYATYHTSSEKEKLQYVWHIIFNHVERGRRLFSKGRRNCNNCLFVP